ncbi:DUF4868 domain-containing protein [Massilia niastensis]|uniref:DUF4868 domain-containing protein n=1 Tax=Massilia niastensis TaxID=544911 RepID=UPI00039FBF44|nr:DUF4868 domain-containing protein [Massilia niastensis]
MQAEFDSLKNFDFAQSAVYLWVFKKSSTVRKFNAWYVRTDGRLNQLVKQIVRDEMLRLTEFAPYSYLAEVNENSCLATSSQGSDFSFLKVQVDRPEPEHGVNSIKDIQGAEGYVVKFVSGADTIYAVKRSTASWKTSYPTKYINMIFRNGELAAAEDNGFSIEKTFDFYCVSNSVFIASKRAFESTMGYRTSYAQAFNGLQQNPQFSSLFTNLQPLINYVGTNAIQLRRMAVVEQKGLYAQPAFLSNLQQVNTRRNWGINFDAATNRIVPCDQTARTIMQILLDHRLMSELTNNIYDVPNATPV